MAASCLWDYRCQACSVEYLFTSELQERIAELKERMQKCDSNPEKDMIAFVSKVVAVSPDSILPSARMPQQRRAPTEGPKIPSTYDIIPTEKEEPKEKFVAFARYHLE